MFFTMGYTVPPLRAVLDGITGAGWRGHGLASLGAENDVFMLSVLDQCELLAVTDNRVQSDGK